MVGVVRRRTAAVDTSDPLSTGVLAAAVVVAIGALAGLFLFNLRDTQAVSASGSVQVAEPGSQVPSRVPAVPVEDGTTAAGSAGRDIDGDGDTAADDESVVGERPDEGTADAGEPSTAAPTPDSGDGGAAPADGGDGTAPADGGDGTDPAGDGTEVPDRDGGRGLFSPDDPERVPAIAVRSMPRDLRTVRADLDGDGVDERVWAAIVRDQVQTRVEHRVDGRWVAQDAHPGAAADRLVALRVRDLTGDGRPEVYTLQWVATEGGSLSVWAYRDGDLARMRMAGGCYNDANTVGITGAVVERVDRSGGTIAATCSEEGLPPQQWPSAIYVWRDGRWDFDGLRGRYG